MSDYQILSTKLRVVKRFDGLYVVGAGMLIPIQDEDEGLELIKKLKVLDLMEKYEPNNPTLLYEQNLL